MDLLNRVAPSAHDLLGRVDEVLVGCGAPATHPIWAWLRRLGTTSVDALRFCEDLDPAALRATAVALRGQAGDYAHTRVPTQLSWQGAGAEAFLLTARALAAHLDHTAAGEDAGETMTGRLSATAGFVEDLADWAQASRDRMARTLTEAITSAQAITIRSRPWPRPPVAEPSTLAGQVPPGVVCAAADLGAHVLDTAGGIMTDGHDLSRYWRGRLDQLGYQSPGPGEPFHHDTTLHLSL